VSGKPYSAPPGTSDEVRKIVGEHVTDLVLEESATSVDMAASSDSPSSPALK
jgi:hypothetical protein